MKTVLWDDGLVRLAQKRSEGIIGYSLYCVKTYLLMKIMQSDNGLVRLAPKKRGELTLAHKKQQQQQQQ